MLNARQAVLLLVVTIPTLLCVSVSAFSSSVGRQSINTQAPSHATKSPLFHAAPRSVSSIVAVPNAIVAAKSNPLFMAEDDEASPSEVEKKKEKSGFLTALLLAPPLIAKFIIVLVVKFLQDVVVYPFLFLYRAVRRTKNKTKAALKGDGADEDPSTSI